MIIFVFSDRVALLSHLQLRKALAPMEVTLAGMVMVCRVSQLWKASSPMAVMFFPNETVSSLLQSWNSPFCSSHTLSLTVACLSSGSPRKGARPLS